MSKNKHRVLTRRDLLAGGTALVAGVAAASCLPGVGGNWPVNEGACEWTEPIVSGGPTSHKVVQVSNASLVNAPPNVSINTSKRSDGRTQPQATLEDALLRLTQAGAIAAAWAQLLPGYVVGQTVGIKVNVLNAMVPTHPELVQELVASLQVGGVSREDILVWDRRLDELKGAGFTESALGCKVIGTMETAQQQGSGPGYEATGICIGGTRARMSTIMTRQVDHLINFSVLKNHLASGFTGALKNHYGTIHNPGTFHDKMDETTQEVTARRFEQAIPSVNAEAVVRDKTRLCLMDASIVVIKGDTDSAPDSLPMALLASTDPVALDARGRLFRDELVVKSGSTPSAEVTSEGWLKVCERVGLGSMKFELDAAELKP